MMLREGETLTLRRGSRVQVSTLLGTGGEAAAYQATELKTGEEGVLKAFTNNCPERVTRTQYLVELELSKRNPLFFAPTDWLQNGRVAHFSPLAPGDSLDEYLEGPGNPLPENCKVAIAVSHAHALLDEYGLSHGDIHLRNYRVVRTATGVRIGVIDFDNFIARGLPPPLAIGQEHAMAPELRAGLKAGNPIPPDKHSDLFAHTVLMHEVLLAKHPASGFDDELDRFDACMMSGRWWHDPALGSNGATSGEGYPSAILNSELARLFRRGLGLNREDRPAFREWRDALSRNFERIYVHAACGGPVFTDAGKSHCPFCRQPYPMLKLVFPSFHKGVTCDSAALPIGRSLLASPKVSAQHAVVRRLGPETTIESFGRNGTYRFVAGRWVAVTNAVLETGDRLRFADVEAQVQEVA